MQAGWAAGCLSVSTMGGLGMVEKAKEVPQTWAAMQQKEGWGWGKKEKLGRW